MLYYGTVDCTAEVGVLIRDDTGFVADAIIYILKWRNDISGLWDGSRAEKGPRT